MAVEVSIHGADTSGVGTVPSGINISSKNLKPGDVIIISGSIGDHGMAVMSKREGLGFETDILSDSAPLNSLVADMLAVCPDIHAFRDPTRGGVTSTLIEFAEGSGVGIVIDEKTLPIMDSVRGACEILGLDPLYVANEGKLIASVPADRAAAVLRGLCASLAIARQWRWAVKFFFSSGDYDGIFTPRFLFF